VPVVRPPAEGHLLLSEGPVIGWIEFIAFYGLAVGLGILWGRRLNK